jgi:hypothetical protein
MKTIFVILLSVIQLPFVIEGWISYFLNCIMKMLSNITILFALISLTWWPLDMLSGACWAVCEYFKQKLLGRDLRLVDALGLYSNIFPTI